MKITDNKTQETDNNTSIDIEWLKGVLKKRDRLLQCLRKANAEIGKLIEENYYLKEYIVSKWSEEHEKLLKIIFDSLNTYAKNGHPCLKSVVKDEIDWLKSIKDRVQPKQEWSEEDRIHYNKCLQYLESTSPRKEDIEWFKSLTPQTTWKPSDEQMKALGIAIRCGIQLGTWEEKALKSLNEQLKKIREE